MAKKAKKNYYQDRKKTHRRFVFDCSKRLARCILRSPEMREASTESEGLRTLLKKATGYEI